jgi:hypothetical protein
VCEFEGVPAPTYKWYKGAREIFDSPKYTILQDGGRQTLIINELYGEDADEFSCRATNEGGVKSTRCDVIIKCTRYGFKFAQVHINTFSAKPRVYIPPRYQSTVPACKGETITLKLPFRGFPRPRAFWTKDGVPLSAIDNKILMECTERFVHTISILINSIL